METKEYLNINGNPFTYRNIDTKWISPLEGGYIITPQGYFIPVKDGDDHSTIFSEYLSRYLERLIDLETMKGAIMLTQNNHIVYMGIKLSDMKDIYTHNGTSEGFGLLLFPENIENLSNEQKEACITLIASNKKIFGSGEKIPMQYHILNTNSSKEYSKEEMLDILNKQSKHR